MHAYEPRPIRFHGIRDVDGWRLKRYSIAFGGHPVDWPAFEAASTLAHAALPRPAVAAERVGVGFEIAHQGRTALYYVLGWWDNENELPLRIFVRALEGGAQWRAARGSESVCVWDLQVVAFERDTYVATVLAGDADPGAASQAYLAAVLSREPAASPQSRPATAAGAR
jgi:hypothetical protein